MAYQHLYQGFLQATAPKQHYACHSHYFWPDCTRQAMCEYWDDSAKYVDEKWSYFFATLVPELQQRISDTLNTGHPQQIVFASNTHELLYRVMSTLREKEPFTVVTTDSEFHSFQRQVSRLHEDKRVNLVVVASEPFATFSQRFTQAIKEHSPDLVFFSQVFFNSGFVVDDLSSIVESVTNDDTRIVIDGYHGFMAKPTDLSSIAHRVFYLAGSYKYAQGGEGACFMHVPPNCRLRPAYTGWFAEFGALDKPRAQQVQYSQDGMRFAGATMDFTALYRLRAVLRLFEQEQLTVSKINRYVMALQADFLHKLDQCEHPLLNSDALVVEKPSVRGHFLAFTLPDVQQTQRIANELKQQGLLTDHRGNKLRFGFGLYHTCESIDLSAIAMMAKTDRTA